MSHKLIQQVIFSDIYQNKNKQYMLSINMLFKKHGDQITNNFYSQLSALEETNDFLTTELVEKRLKASLKKWLISITDLDLNSDFSILFEGQQLIGKAHARIRVPIHLVTYGIDILKQNFFEILQQEHTDANERLELLNLTNRIIDFAVMLFNQIYYSKSINQDKNEHNLRQHFISHNLALEFEQSRADLLHWQRELLTLLFYPYSKVKTRNITLLSLSKFGLWIEHRAVLLFYKENEVQKLRSNLYKADELVKQVVNLNQDEKWEQLAQKVTELDNLVTSTDWLLDHVAKDIAAMDNNKDPLTKMFSRRYLPNIIQHEIHYCLERDVSFGVIMVDLDHFKDINDQFGHTVGDSVLSRTAILLSSSIRAYDYVFRYGGEEFLIIINNTDVASCLSKAEEIRAKVANYKFKDLPFINSPITISLGVAIFNKHPDYEQLINQADQALYSAKENGRNRVALHRE